MNTASEAPAQATPTEPQSDAHPDVHAWKYLAGDVGDAVCAFADVAEVLTDLLGRFDWEDGAPEEAKEAAGDMSTALYWAAADVKRGLGILHAAVEGADGNTL